MEQLILSEIHQLPEHLKLEVLHFTQFLKKGLQILFPLKI